MLTLVCNSFKTLFIKRNFKKRSNILQNIFNKMLKNDKNGS